MPFPGQDKITRLLLVLPMIASACLGVPDTGHADELTGDTAARLDSVLEKLRAAHDVPGLAVGILDNSEPVYAKGFGVRSLETGAPVDADTLFPVASISKTFTATAIMQLAERQTVDLNARLSTYLPQFRRSGISILNLLTHTAGLSDAYAPKGRSGEEAVLAYVANVADDGTDFVPGTGWAYADTHFNILGAVVQSLTETPFPDYAKDKLLAPLGMTRSSFRPVADTENVALPHTGWLRLSPGGGRPWDIAFAPSEGLHSSAREMLIWAKANLDYDPRLMLPGTYATMHEPRMDTAWDGVRMALGWQIEGPPDAPVLRHAGGMDGVAALLTLYPESGRAIVILSNAEETPRFEIRRAVNAILDDSASTDQEARHGSSAPQPLQRYHRKHHEHNREQFPQARGFVNENPRQNRNLGSIALLPKPVAIDVKCLIAVFHNQNASAVLTTASQTIIGAWPAFIPGQGSETRPALSTATEPAPMLISVTSPVGKRPDLCMARPATLDREFDSKQTQPRKITRPPSPSSVAGSK